MADLTEDVPVRSMEGLYKCRDCGEEGEDAHANAKSKECKKHAEWLDKRREKMKVKALLSPKKVFDPQTIPVASRSNPFAVFSMFWPLALWDTVGKKGDIHPMDGRRYFAVNTIINKLVRLPDFKDYWRDTEFFSNPFIQRNLSMTNYLRVQKHLIALTIEVEGKQVLVTEHFESCVKKAFSAYKNFNKKTSLIMFMEDLLRPLTAIPRQPTQKRPSSATTSPTESPKAKKQKKTA